MLGLKKYLQKSFLHWLSKRIPAGRSVALNHRNIFIFPSKSGFVFLLISVLVWLLGTNYQSNLALLCAYFMFAIFVVGLHHTFSNLSGLTVTGLSSQAVFAGDDCGFDIQLQRAGSGNYESIILQWPQGRAQLVNLQKDSKLQTRVFCKTTKRGYCYPGRLLIESYYPLGLFRCWTHLDLNVKALVYPAPINAGPLPKDALSLREGGAVATDGGEDFIGLKNYQHGHSLKHIAWKQYARGQGMLLKDYCDYRSHQLWLQWEALPGMAREARLARLCYWLLQVSKTEECYGLRLPKVEIQPNSSLQHKLKVLQALALFELETDNAD